MSDTSSGSPKRRSLRGVKGLGPSSKKAGSFHSTGFGEIESALERGSTRREFDTLQYIPVAAVRLDSEQPRRLGMQIEWLQDPDSAPGEKREIVDGIRALAASMETEQYTPIDVYQDDLAYALIAGERRYWAARLNDHESIFAKVLTEKPQDLRLRQLVENVAREELSTAEMLDALIGVVAEGASIGRPIENGGTLARATGMRESTAYRWWAVLQGGDELHEAVRRGMSLSDAYAKAPSVRKGSKAPAKRSAKPTEHVSLTVKVANKDKARALYERLGGSAPDGVAWQNPKAARKALLAQIETLLADD